MSCSERTATRATSAATSDVAAARRALAAMSLMSREVWCEPGDLLPLKLTSPVGGRLALNLFRRKGRAGARLRCKLRFSQVL